MKQKLIGLLACLLALIVAFAATGWENDTKIERYHQHLSSPNASLGSEGSGDSLQTNLPILTIDTAGKDISPVGTLKAEQTVAEICVYDRQGQRNSLGNEPDQRVLAHIRIRGNSSRYFMKKQYKLCMIDAAGADLDVGLLGMASSEEWVLGAPILDRTLLRNYMAYNVCGQVMPFTPEVRFCECYINGQYSGVYLLTEQIQVGKKHVNISETRRGAVSTGYLLRVDRYDPRADNLENFTSYTYNLSSSVEILYPPAKNITEAQIEWITNDFSEFEHSLYSFDYNTPDWGYRRYIDVDSFVDYFLLNEFCQNYDAGSYSTYIYRDLQGKISMGPVWDFNNAFDNYMETAFDGTGIRMTAGTWFTMLIRDDAFVNKVIARYRQLRRTVLSQRYLLGYIDEVVAYLGDAVDRNYEVWGATFEVEKLDYRDKLEPDSRNPKSYEEAIEQLKDFIVTRGNWLDAHIADLKEFSSPNANKKLNNAK